MEEAPVMEQTISLWLPEYVIPIDIPDKKIIIKSSSVLVSKQTVIDIFKMAVLSIEKDERYQWKESQKKQK